MKGEKAASPPVGEDVSLLTGIAEREEQEEAQLIDQKSTEQQLLYTILVVEDDPDLASLEAGILSAHGYTVVAVNSGELAITTLHHSLPDLVVLDLELLGNVNGWDVLNALRLVANTPVLVTTSSTTAVRQYIRSYGEARSTLDHLLKPYPMQTFLKRVKRMLSITPR